MAPWCSLGPAGGGRSGRAPGMEGDLVGTGFGMGFPSPDALGWRWGDACQAMESSGIRSSLCCQVGSGGDSSSAVRAQLCGDIPALGFISSLLFQSLRSSSGPGACSCRWRGAAAAPWLILLPRGWHSWGNLASLHLPAQGWEAPKQTCGGSSSPLKRNCAVQRRASTLCGLKSECLPGLECFPSALPGLSPSHPLQYYLVLLFVLQTPAPHL